LQRTDTGKHELTITPDALVQLQQRGWPGNIRELRNVLERARLFADDGVIRAAYLPAAPQPVTDQPSAGNSLDHVLATFQGTRSELAKSMGISERTLYRRLKEQGLA
jgi:transcriptional regulator of acetoin/glycerol metabolism